MKKLATLAVVALALASASVAGAATPTFESAVSVEVARQVGQPVDVACGDFWSWPSQSLLGFFDGRSIRYSPSVCASARWAFEHPAMAWRLRYCAGYVAGACPAWLPVVRSIVALAHETWHARGVFDEAAAQCYATQTADEFAAALGFPRSSRFDATQSVGFDYLAWLYQRELPSLYRSNECRPGGALDLTPNDGLWP